VPNEAGFGTVAGFVIHRFGELPKKGQSIRTNGWRIEIGSDFWGPAKLGMPESLVIST